MKRKFIQLPFLSFTYVSWMAFCCSVLLPLSINGQGNDCSNPNFSCIGEVNITLNANCEATLIPAMLLTGNTNCLSNFSFAITVEDDDPTNGAQVDGCGRFRYQITSTGTGNSNFTNCWGFVNAEDKTPPAIVQTPADVDLLCVDVAANTVATLPVNVSKCFLVAGTSGTVLSGTMSPLLRERLLAGGQTPLLPTFTDGCADQLEVCVADAIAYAASDPSCNDAVLTRTFRAREITTCNSGSGQGNGTVATSFQITFVQPTLADLNVNSVPAVVSYEACGVQQPTRADYPAPRPADYPFLQVGERILPLANGAPVCNIGVTYADGLPIVTCPFTYKFVRTYTIIDWCHPSDIRTVTQVVKVGDTTAPVFTGPNVPRRDGALVYGTNAGNSCAAYLRLDDVSAVDNCSGGNVSIAAVIYLGGDLNRAPVGSFAITPGGTPELSSLIPAGRHLLRYTYQDQCGNTGVSDFQILIEDQTPPVAICEDGLNISIGGGTGNGFAVLTADLLDNGSYDDCSAITRSIARVNASNVPIGSYSDQILLDCEDVGTVRVSLRVSDAVGNTNYCWLTILLEDKLPPSCIAPANTSITCLEYSSNLPNNIQDVPTATLDALFGAAAQLDNCGATISQTINGAVNSCGVGAFTRVFVATDDAGFTNRNACTQRINVLGVHDYRLTFPVDESGSCAAIPDYAGVAIEQLACDLMTTYSETDTFRTLTAGEECFKLRITYDIVNWCEYNTLGEPYVVPRNGNGVVNRQRQPRNLETDQLYVNVIPNNTNSKNDDQAFMTLFTDRELNANTVQRDQEFPGYGGSNSRGFFRYTQFIKIYDEVAPEITFNEMETCFAGNRAGCRATTMIEFTATDECSAANVSVELDVNYLAGNFISDNAAAQGIGISVDNDGAGNYTLTATNVPVGDHALRIRAADGCGNFDVQIIEFCVTPDRSPTPICIQTLTVVLMDDGADGGTAAIWASDFIASPVTDCFGNEVTNYSIYRSSTAGQAGFVPRFNPPTTNGIVDINCEDATNGTINVRVYAFDALGTTPDYCEVVVTVQDNADHCAENRTGNLSGLIATPENVGIGNVALTLSGGDQPAVSTVSSSAGTYQFTGLPLGEDYTIQPNLNRAPNLRNIKSSDLVNMISVILGTEEFDSPYDYVAADVNLDAGLDIFDVINVSQVILGQVDNFAGGSAWIFLDARASLSFNNPYGELWPQVYNANNLAGNLRADFVAVEVGNTFDLAPRSVLQLKVDDVLLRSGQVQTITIDGQELAAFQGTLALGSDLELLDATYTGKGGLNLSKATAGFVALALREGGSVSLTVQARKDLWLHDVLTLTDAITIREGVDSDGVGHQLQLTFNPVATGAAEALHQNFPNPVVASTTIGFELLSPSKAILTLQDITGRVIIRKEIAGVAGMNLVELTNIDASGVLTYTLTAGKFTASRQMIVVR